MRRPIVSRPTPKRSGFPLPAILREVLERAGFATLEQLAVRTGLRKQTLYAIRCGARTMSRSVASAIARELHVPEEIVAGLFAAPREKAVRP